MKKLIIASLLLTMLAVAPAPALAQTDTGPTPGSFWYGITTTFENVNLFFTFNSEKKAEKALRYAEKRLSQVTATAESGNAEAAEIALADYEAKIALAEESSKKVKDTERAEKLFTTIADNTSKHQETLGVVLDKVPEEAREAITRAIEVSKRGQEEATRQIAELKGEVEQLKQELAELKAKDEEREKTIEDLKKQQSSETVSPKKQDTPSAISDISPTQKTATPEIQTPTKTTKEVTLPNGAIIEMDENGNIIRTIKEAPQQTYSPATPTNQTKPDASVQISSINVTPTITTAKIEWETDKPTESKIFLSSGELSSKVYNSESGLSTRHSVSVNGLKGATSYTYEIEAIANGNAYKKTGNFLTETPPPPEFSIKKEAVLPQSSWPEWNYFKTNKENGDFVLEALTLQVSNPDEKVGSHTKIGEIQWRTLDKQGWNYRTCDAINDAFMSWQNTGYKYPCPTSSNPKYLTYSNPDWQGNDVNLTINPNITFPPGVEIYYYKVVETNTGQVFEYQK
ncbi:MAG: DUF5667 domain-containing protein [Candidatus Paceibacterota bacterium]